ncbi:hypothetical protein TNCV_84351 [Trichonephila clavipes]|nr:hypothetical protein TNCV_84351 [Trichonephila clavipes]
MEIEISFYSHPETHKDPVGTALHIQEANMDDTTQTKTHTERAAAGYMTTEKRAKRERLNRRCLLGIRTVTQSSIPCHDRTWMWGLTRVGFFILLSGMAKRERGSSDIGFYT